MGYRVFGDITVVLPQETADIAILRLDDLAQAVAKSLTGPLSSQLAQAGGLELVDSWVDDNGSMTVECAIDKPWDHDTPAALGWVVSCGGGVVGTLRGEDGEAWGYYCQPGSSELVEIPYESDRKDFLEAAAGIVAWWTSHKTAPLPPELAEYVDHPTLRIVRGGGCVQPMLKRTERAADTLNITKNGSAGM